LLGSGVRYSQIAGLWISESRVSEPVELLPKLDDLADDDEGRGLRLFPGKYLLDGSQGAGKDSLLWGGTLLDESDGHFGREAMAKQVGNDEG